jgi:hypothetical protein
MRHFIAVAAFLFATQSFAQQKPLDDASTKALQQTQALMGDPKAIGAYAAAHPDAQKANSDVKSLTGGNAEDSAAVYKLASDIFGNMAKESGGDAAGMSNTLAQAMKNPQAFADNLTPEQKAQLKTLTTHIESHAPTSAPH